MASGQLRTAQKAEIFQTLLIGCFNMECQLLIKLRSRNCTLRDVGCADREKEKGGIRKSKSFNIGG